MHKYRGFVESTGSDAPADSGQGGDGRQRDEVKQSFGGRGQKLDRSDVAYGFAVSVPVEGTIESPLIGERALLVVPCVHRGATRLRQMGERRAAIVGQKAREGDRAGFRESRLGLH